MCHDEFSEFSTSVRPWLIYKTYDSINELLMTVCCNIVLMPKSMNCACEIKSIPTQSTYIGNFGGERGGRRVEAMLSGSMCNGF